MIFEDGFEILVDYDSVDVGAALFVCLVVGIKIGGKGVEIGGGALKLAGGVEYDEYFFRRQSKDEE